MTIMRVNVRWSGFLGAPGYSAFHFAGGGGLISDAQQVVDRTADALSNLLTILPEGLRLNFESEVEVLDEATGVIEAYEPITDPDISNPLGGEGYSGASGAVVNWRTDNVRNGRRIRGRTFIVPLAGIAYQTNGTLTDSALDRLRGFGEDMIGWDIDSRFGVWARPINGAGGQIADVTSYSVPDMAAVLRSRRD